MPQDIKAYVRQNGQWWPHDDEAMLREYFDKWERLANGAILILDERSPMKKAVKITADNQKSLEFQYQLDEHELEDYLDYWLIADFGASRPDGYLDQASFEETFDVLESPKLDNEYVAIVPEGTPVA